jgi:hypothetical protein
MVKLTLEINSMYTIGQNAYTCACLKKLDASAIRPSKEYKRPTEKKKMANSNTCGWRLRW